MTDTQLTFERYEKKYMIRPEQVEQFRGLLDSHLLPDKYFSSTVCSLYYDTDDYRLIRTSIEKPVYKEKLRLRSYNVPAQDDNVFLELKSKFKSLGYKRRVMMRADQARAYLAGCGPAPEDSQVQRELDWFLKCNPVSPKAFVACDRKAYVLKDDPRFRITFDEDLRWRDTELDLCLGSHGSAVLPAGYVLMELKIPQSVPIWLSRLLSTCRIYPVSFSKYGTCYRENLMNGVVYDV